MHLWYTIKVNFMEKNMKVIIIGGGKVGKTLVKHLLQEGHNITVIEKNKNILDMVINTYDVAGVLGNGAVAKIQEEAGVDKADLFISVTDNDELNLISCKVARYLGAKNVVARVRDTEYTDQAELMRIGFGIDLIVNPEQATAEEIANLLRFPLATKVHSFEKGRVVSVEIKLLADSPFLDKSVEEVVKGMGAELVIGSIIRDDKTIIPRGEDKFCEGDYVSFVSAPTKIDAFFKKAGIYKQRVKSCLIIGGSRISYHLIKKLQDVGIKVKVIEKDANRCNQLLETIDKVDVINADGTQKQVLDEEGLKEFDAIVSLTGMDEQNIIISLYAKSQNIKTVISKVNNDTFVNILDEINLDANISPKDVVASQIVKYARLIKSKEETSIENMHKDIESKLEVVELKISENEDNVGKSIKDMKIRENTIITSIIRGSDIIVPNGETVLNAGDKIIISTTRTVDGLGSIIK